MKQFFIGLLLALAVGCSPAREVVEVYQGTPGAQGPTGPVGPIGPNGHSLVSESVSASGCECDQNGGSRLDIYLDLDDSLSVSEGDLFQSSLVACNGRNGLNGTNGADGAPGLPGVQGPQGEQGPQGLPGEQGPQGVAGADGSNGADGAQGIAGPAGAVGPQGPQGVAGPVGPAGPQGPQGTAGAQGPAGAGATIQNYNVSSSCLSIGDGLYAKESGSAVKIYSNSSCTTNVAAINNEQDSVWITATRLGFKVSGDLRVIKFN